MNRILTSDSAASSGFLAPNFRGNCGVYHFGVNATDWDAYFASLPRGEEALSIEEMASFGERGRASEAPVTLQELKAEVEALP